MNLLDVNHLAAASAMPLKLQSYNNRKVKLDNDWLKRHHMTLRMNLP